MRVAIQATLFEYPARRVTVNLAPADLPKVTTTLLIETNQCYIRI
ncbi:MAG: hypothetical protein ACYDBH_18550 [Acidobacteriaceae bacterium]